MQLLPATMGPYPYGPTTTSRTSATTIAGGVVPLTLGARALHVLSFLGLS